MKKRILQTLAMAAAVICLDLFTFGCAALDLNGDGKVDPFAFLEGVDISVAFTGEDGQVYNMAVDELGKKMLGQFIQDKTGYLFEVTEEGGITVTDPSGVAIQIKQKPE